MLIPFKTRYEEKGQDGICHKYIVSAVTATDIANNGLGKIQVFSAICNSHYEKHCRYASRLLIQ